MELNVRISTVSSNGSSTTSDFFQQDFSGKELLLLLRLQTDPELFESWKANVISGDSDEDYSLAVSLAKQSHRELTLEVCTGRYFSALPGPTKFRPGPGPYVLLQLRPGPA